MCFFFTQKCSTLSVQLTRCWLFPFRVLNVLKFFLNLSFIRAHLKVILKKHFYIQMESIIYLFGILNEIYIMAHMTALKSKLACPQHKYISIHTCINFSNNFIQVSQNRLTFSLFLEITVAYSRKCCQLWYFNPIQGHENHEEIAMRCRNRP